MHNPFPFFSPSLLRALIKAGHKYFIRQTYSRGVDHFDENQKGSFLITHYNEKGRAQIHFDALKNDGNRFFYDITDQEHMEKLNVAATQPAGYRIYTPLLTKEWTPSKQLAGNMRKYIDNVLQWRPGRDETVKTNLFVQFGELFVTLKLRIHEVKIPLADLERL